MLDIKTATLSNTAIVETPWTRRLAQNKAADIAMNNTLQQYYSHKKSLLHDALAMLFQLAPDVAQFTTVPQRAKAIADLLQDPSFQRLRKHTVGNMANTIAALPSVVTYLLNNPLVTKELDGHQPEDKDSDHPQKRQPFDHQKASNSIESVMRVAASFAATGASTHSSASIKEHSDAVLELLACMSSSPHLSKIVDLLGSMKRAANSKRTSAIRHAVSAKTSIKTGNKIASLVASEKMKLLSDNKMMSESVVNKLIKRSAMIRVPPPKSDGHKGPVLISIDTSGSTGHKLLGSSFCRSDLLLAVGLFTWLRAIQQGRPVFACRFNTRITRTLTSTEHSNAKSRDLDFFLTRPSNGTMTRPCLEGVWHESRDFLRKHCTKSSTGEHLILTDDDDLIVSDTELMAYREKESSHNIKTTVVNVCAHNTCGLSRLAAPDSLHFVTARGLEKHSIPADLANILS